MARSRGSDKAVSRVITDHDEIKEWVESRGGHPATVKRTHGKEEPGIIRIDFPGFKGSESLEPISWDEFFEQFESRSLAFLCQDRTISGEVSRFNKIISREREESAKGKKKAA